MTVRTEAVSLTSPRPLVRVLAVVAGALFVALAAQIAVPVPGTPVPFTLQVPAVLIVGAVLGPGLGAASMVLYLAAGAVGVPVFAPGGVVGLARLFGPTGGYLLAFPLAAAVAGRFAAVGGFGTMVAGLVAGLLLIHAGGVAQLAILGGDMAIAIQLGSVPFLLMDVLKLAVAAAVVRAGTPPVKRLLR